MTIVLIFAWVMSTLTAVSLYFQLRSANQYSDFWRKLNRETREFHDKQFLEWVSILEDIAKRLP